jgi:hypothetical protein
MSDKCPVSDPRAPRVLPKSLILWWAVTGSNRRPSRCKQSAHCPKSLILRQMPLEPGENMVRTSSGFCPETVPQSFAGDSDGYRPLMKGITRSRDVL